MKKRKKLALSVEAIRVLDDAALSGAPGAKFAYWTETQRASGCTVGSYTCNASCGGTCAMSCVCDSYPACYPD